MGPSFPVQTAASMVGGTLFTYPDNFRAQKAEIAAKYSGAKLTVSKDFKFGETNKSAEFLKKFAEFSGKGDKKKEEKPKKEQQPKKEPEKKKEKPAEKAEEEDDGMPKEPKAKDPLAALPKGTF